MCPFQQTRYNILIVGLLKKIGIHLISAELPLTVQVGEDDQAYCVYLLCLIELRQQRLDIISFSWKEEGDCKIFQSKI